MLNQASSVWTAPPTGVITGTMTRGPLLGNGGIGVTALAENSVISLLISHNGFICDAHRAGPARIGGVTIAPMEAPAGKTPAQPFKMEQDLARAEMRADVGGGWSLRAFVAATCDALVVEVINPTDKPIPLRISTWTPPASKVFPASAGSQGDAHWATRETYAGTVTPEQTDGKPRLAMPARWVSRAALATRIPGVESKTELDAKANTVSHIVTLTPGQKIQVITRIGMVRGASPLAATLATVARDTPGSIGQMQVAHAAWWRAYWEKSQVVLNDAILNRYYHTALYAMACANRAGQDAPGLYGCWITKDAAAWASDIHLNYNGQAPYFGVYSANRPELAAPFNAAMLAMMPEGRRRAKEDARYIHPSLKGKSFAGILYPVGICSSLGVAACDRYLNQVYDASYSAMQFIEQYEYTQDDTFLKNEAYPFVLACGEFWESYLELTEVGGNKQYTFSGGTREGMWARTPSTDIGYIKRIFTFLIASAKTLGRDESRRAKWQDILDHLPPFPTITRNGKTFIAWDADGRFGTGENCFGIDCIYPGNAMNLESDPESLKLAQDTANLYTAWDQANNLPRIFLSHLRVGANEVATRNAFFTLIKKRTGPNGFIVDPYHGLEKCGGIEVVNRLLLSSDAGVMRIFPAWDHAQDAAFINLRAKGAFLVTAGIKDSTIRGVCITSEKGRDLTVVNPWPGRAVRVTRNGTLAESVAGDRFTVKTSIAETIGLKPE